MEIKKFRIFNYKSIVDSGDCYFSPTVTIFAGKNEAGKTSILEALEDFNELTSIRDKAIAISDAEAPKPAISVTFLVNKDDIEDIFAEHAHKTAKPLSPKYEIEIRKDYPDKYSCVTDISTILGLDQVTPNNAKEDEAKHLFVKLSELHGEANILGITGVHLPPFPIDTPMHYLEAIKVYRSALTPHLEKIPEPKRAEIISHCDRLLGVLPQTVVHGLSSATFLKGLLEYIPNFILFSSFEDVFPNKIPLSELAENKWIKDLSVISDLDVKTIVGGEERLKKTHKNKINIQLNGDYKKFWVQDAANLEIDWDGQNLYFWIEEDGRFYEPEIRSQGKRWHLSFYLRISARARENVRNVILIDEPGLYLHAIAQQDILRSLEEAAAEAPVLFSTHSPYLLEADKLDRLRLVIKTKERGTVVENKIHKVADKETLRPILTAIGLELNSGIAHVNHAKNVVVEGPSDYFYLNAFKLLLEKETINIVFGGGAGNMPKVGTILQGWGCDVIYLYDDDKGHKDALKNIKAEWLITTPDLLAIIPVSGGAIEDVISKPDYIKHILAGDEASMQGKNSEISKKRDKVLDSKLFLERTREKKIKIDAETKKNAQGVFDLIEGKFRV